MEQEKAVQNQLLQEQKMDFMPKMKGFYLCVQFD